MHLIFIRHGDPDYSVDSVTPKGRREVSLLGERLARTKVSAIYVSPMGRAQVTAASCVEKLHEAGQKPPVTTLSWLREFSYPIVDPTTGRSRIAWDWLPRVHFNMRRWHDVRRFYTTKAMRSGHIKEHYRQVCRGLDEVLAAHGYTRVSSTLPVWRCTPHLSAAQAAVDTHLQVVQRDLDETTLVFVCHLGVMFVMLSHLTAISPVQLWQSFFVAPSSITIANAEERFPGEVAFRLQCVGDTAHLTGSGEIVSASGFFGSCLSI